jgi:uncharacterized protein YegL
MGVNESEYLTALASLVTGKKCKVIVKGSNACMNKADNDQCFIILPANAHCDTIPFRAEATDEEIKDLREHLSLTVPTVDQMVQGFDGDVESVRKFLRRAMLYHESAHGLYSPPNSMMAKLDPNVRSAHNFLEDRRIETLFAMTFPEMYTTFNKVNKAMLKNFDARAKRDGKELSPAARMFLYSIVGSYKRYDLAKPEIWDGHPIVDRIEQMIEEVESNPDDIDLPLTLAKELVKLCQVPPEKPEPRQCRGKGKGQPGQEGKTKAGKSKSKDEQKQKGQGNAHGDVPDKPEDGEGEGDEPQPDEGEGEQPEPQEGEGDEDVLDMSDIDELMDEYKDLNINSTEVGTSKSVNVRTASLINQQVAAQVSAILKNMHGAKDSVMEDISDDGYAIDIEEVMQMKASPTGDGFKPFIDTARDAPEYDIVLCIDHSGSMEGTCIDQAKRSAATLASACEQVGLNVAILAFTGDTTLIKDFNTPIENTLLGQLDATGGTCIGTALRDANSKLEERIRQVDSSHNQAIILVSDGEDYNMNEISNQISRAKRNGELVYFIGIGSGPRSLITNLSAYARFDHASFVGSDARGIGQALRGMAEKFIRDSR